MAGKRKLVNLDAMIPRADFAVQPEAKTPATDKIGGLSIADLRKDSLILPNLRKPDFQRETNHWTPAQVSILINCFVTGELIPSVILWQSPAYLFVIDGGHRLSALRAWVENDYGDGTLSLQLFGTEISKEQKKAAAETRKLVEDSTGSWQEWQAKNQVPDLPEEERKRVNLLMARALPLQWVNGDAEKAESSFYRINTQGTPLDDVEELLIRNRKKPIPIAARSILRAGMGHKYWSRFAPDKGKQIEQRARDVFELLFVPDVDPPLKTLDLPLGGNAGVRSALQVLIEFILIANRNQQNHPDTVASQPDDADGDGTLTALGRTLGLARRITGHDHGSLGLHPAVYFYGPAGRHSPALFMGVSTLIASKLENNDKAFFRRFTKVRKSLEDLLLSKRHLLAAIVQQSRSGKRPATIAALFEYMIESIDGGTVPTDMQLVEKAGVSGTVIAGSESAVGKSFSDETKSEVFLRKALEAALRCAVCGGYLSVEKSVSYDHKIGLKDGGMGYQGNCDLTHPYCNQAIKQ